MLVRDQIMKAAPRSMSLCRQFAYVILYLLVLVVAMRLFFTHFLFFVIDFAHYSNLEEPLISLSLYVIY